MRAIVPGGDLSRAEVEHVVLPATALRLLELLTGPGRLLVDIKSTLCSHDLAPLTRPFLGRLADDLLSPEAPPARDLLIIPSGGLWAVPFVGLPLTGPQGSTALIRDEHHPGTVAALPRSGCPPPAAAR